MAEPDRQPKKTLRQLRQERGWSLLDVARRLGVSESIVSRWERGERVPQPANQQRLAEFFGVSVEAIAFGPAEQVPQDRP